MPGDSHDYGAPEFCKCSKALESRSEFDALSVLSIQRSRVQAPSSPPFYKHFHGGRRAALREVSLTHREASRQRQHVALTRLRSELADDGCFQELPRWSSMPNR